MSFMGGMLGNSKIMGELLGSGNKSQDSQPSQSQPDLTGANQVDYSKLMPNANQLGNFQPMSYQDFGSVPYVNSATVTAPKMGQYGQMSAATLDQSTMPGALNQYEQMLQKSLNPSFQQQDQQLTAQLASSGLLDSSAGIQGHTNLQGQQAAALSSGMMPLVNDFANFYQQNNLRNNENQQNANSTNTNNSFNEAVNNAGFQQNAGQLNQGALNQGNEYNSMLYNNTVNKEMDNQNAYLSSLGTMQDTQNSALLTGALGSYDPNNAAASSLYSQGLGNASKAYSDAYSAGSGNTAAYSSALGKLGQDFGNSLFKPKTAKAGGNGSLGYTPEPFTF